MHFLLSSIFASCKVQDCTSWFLSYFLSNIVRIHKMHLDVSLADHNILCIMTTGNTSIQSLFVRQNSFSFWWEYYFRILTQMAILLLSWAYKTMTGFLSWSDTIWTYRPWRPLSIQIYLIWSTSTRNAIKTICIWTAELSFQFVLIEIRMAKWAHAWKEMMIMDTVQIVF